MNSDLKARLEALSAKATPGVWNRDSASDYISAGDADLFSSPDWWPATDFNEWDANMNFICELVNAYRASELVPATALTDAVAEISRLRQDNIEGLQFVLSVVADPDRQLCCSGRDCGCQGSTVGQYAAWAFKDARAALDAPE